MIELSKLSDESFKEPFHVEEKEHHLNQSPA